MRMNNIRLASIVGAVYLFLYLPILVLIVFSFNDGISSYEWRGFTLRWYHELILNSEIWSVLRNSLIVAFSATALSLILGTMVVYGLQQKLDRMVQFFYLPILVPEIVLSVGFLYLFSFLRIPMGLPTLIAAHTLLGLAFVVPLVHTRFAEMDKNLVEASLDLGASQWQTFTKVVVPFLAPALFSAGLLAWIISFDDFLISFFCAGSSSQTLPLYLYAKIRVGMSPLINVLSAVTLLSSCGLVVIYSYMRSKTEDLI